MYHAFYVSCSSRLPYSNDSNNICYCWCSLLSISSPHVNLKSRKCSFRSINREAIRCVVFSKVLSLWSRHCPEHPVLRHSQCSSLNLRDHSPGLARSKRPNGQESSPPLLSPDNGSSGLQIVFEKKKNVTDSV